MVGRRFSGSVLRMCSLVALAGLTTAYVATAQDAPPPPLPPLQAQPQDDLPALPVFDDLPAPTAERGAETTLPALEPPPLADVTEPPVEVPLDDVPAAPPPSLLDSVFAPPPAGSLAGDSAQSRTSGTEDTENADAFDLPSEGELTTIDDVDFDEPLARVSAQRRAVDPAEIGRKFRREGVRPTLAYPAYKPANRHLPPAPDASGHVAAFLQAARLGHFTGMAAMLTAGLPINVRDASGATALTEAIRYGNVNSVRFLLQRQADANQPGTNGRTPLEMATASGDMILTGLLLAYNADINQADAQGATALQRAQDRRDYGMMYWLLQQGADPLRTDASGLNLLHQAAARGDATAVALLLDNRVPVDIADGNGATALMHAAYHNQTGMVAYLLQEGANIHAQDAAGRQPLDIARQGQAMQAANILQSHLTERYLQTFATAPVPVPVVVSADPLHGVAR